MFQGELHVEGRRTKLEVVPAEAAATAALSLLREMHAASFTTEPVVLAACVSGESAEERPRPVDLWDPDQQLRRMREQADS